MSNKGSKITISGPPKRPIAVKNDDDIMNNQPALTEWHGIFTSSKLGPLVLKGKIETKARWPVNTTVPYSVKIYIKYEGIYNKGSRIEVEALVTPSGQMHVVIGENTAMAACSVIAGSSTLGKNCVIAGLVGINGHIDVVDNVVFTGMSMVTKNINEAGVYSSGMPCQTNKEWNKNNARIRKLESILKRMKSAEHDIEHLNKIIEKE